MVEAPRQPLARSTSARLSGEGPEGDLAVGVLGDLLGEGGLAGAGIAEQAEHLRLAALQPGRDGLERRVLLRGPGHGAVFRRARAARAASRPMASGPRKAM